MKSDYTFHFRNSDLSLLTISYYFDRGACGDFDYRVLLKGDTVAAFLTKKGVKQAHDFGKQLMDKKKAEVILKNLSNFRKELLRLKNFKIDENNLLKMWVELEKYIQRFSELYRYCEKPMLSALEEVITKKVTDPALLNRLLHNPRNLSGLELAEKERHILHVLVEIGHLKFNIHTNVTKLFLLISKFADIISKKYNIPLEEVLVFRGREMTQFLENGKLDLNDIKNRVNGCVLLPQNNEWRCLTGKDYDYWKKELEGKNTDFVRGTIAYPGKAIGQVKFHMSMIKSSNIPKGSILITGMTNPQIVPFLKNAAAIVTDEGGLTCHAAIVARELKIPCIVGTHSATVVFKEGDIVEVDANKGTVKRIR